jgi:hypothetical protein
MSEADKPAPPGPEGESQPIPEGAAVFPLIPAELGVDPLLLAVLHASVFLTGSDEEIVHPAAADEAVEYLGEYLRRLEGPQLARVREDLACLVAFGREEKWPKQLVRYLKSFLADYGVETQGEG